MEVPRKRAKTRPDGVMKGDGAASSDMKVDGAASSSSAAAKQIAELRAELEECKLGKIAAEERHDRVVRDLKESYSDALEWAYSVKHVRREYWLEKGHTDEYADAMEDFLVRFKLIIKLLRAGGAVGDSIYVEFDLEDEEAAHDDVLMIYWKELASTLVHWSEYHADVETLKVSIACIDTPDTVLDVLRPAMKRSSIEHVGFFSDRTPRAWKLAKFIGDIIQTNHHVTSVGFRPCRALK